MKDIIENLQVGDALLLTAPPGWGKTYKLLEAIKDSSKSFVFIFPLRALCEEVYLSALNKKIDTINISSKEDLEIIQQREIKLIISTPEMLLTTNVFKERIYIFDEFHLFYYWGDRFRENLIECYHKIASSQITALFLTATFNEQFKKRWTDEIQLNFKHIYHLDLGNQKLKNYPKKIFYYPKKLKQWLIDDFTFSNVEGTKLIFCQYREEVRQLHIELEKFGYRVLSCVGGEAARFIDDLKDNGKVDYIVATSVISHGVNLPDIGHIYFTYEVSQLDFYLQMVGRGGRSGDAYELHCLNLSFFHIKWKERTRIFLRRVFILFNSLPCLLIKDDS